MLKSALRAERHQRIARDGRANDFWRFGEHILRSILRGVPPVALIVSNARLARNIQRLIAIVLLHFRLLHHDVLFACSVTILNFFL